MAVLRAVAEGAAVHSTLRRASQSVSSGRFVVIWVAPRVSLWANLVSRQHRGLARSQPGQLWQLQRDPAAADLQEPLDLREPGNPVSRVASPGLAAMYTNPPTRVVIG